jgi:microcystin-dependent protein
MAYPPIYTRLGNFQRDANNGLESPAPAKVDAELNGIQLSLAQTIEKLRGITTADGRLRNVASAVAQALVGTWSGTSDGTVTVTTTIPWSSDMSVNSVLVLQGSTLLRPAQISGVQDSGGFLQLTLAVAPTLATTMIVWAFAPGAGVLTRLASTAPGDGAGLLGLHDAGNFYGATTVEGALSEIAGSFLALHVALGPLNNIFKRNGDVVATDDFDMGGNKVTNADDGTDPGDYLTVRQLANYIAAWTDLQQFYLKRDGTTAMAGPMNFGNNKGQNLADPDLAAPLDAVNVRSMLRTIATSGAAPVGIVLDYMGDTAPTGWLFCDGATYLGTVYPVLYGMLGSAYREGYAQGAKVAKFPALIAGTNPGEITATALVPGDITSLLSDAGVGYTGVPVILCQNTDGTTVTTQPTFSVTLSPVVTDGATVTGGSITAISVASGGLGITAGAILIVQNALVATPGEPALAELPSGYFRTPDLRGRVTVGAGTESKIPGVLDAPDVTKGDSYNATPRDIGDTGGAEKHQLTIDEMPSHNHRFVASLSGGDSGATGRNSGRSYTIPEDRVEYTGGDDPHQNMPPFHVLNKIIKAS